MISLSSCSVFLLFTSPEVHLKASYVSDTNAYWKNVNNKRTNMVPMALQYHLYNSRSLKESFNLKLFCFLLMFSFGSYLKNTSKSKHIYIVFPAYSKYRKDISPRSSFKIIKLWALWELCIFSNNYGRAHFSHNDMRYCTFVDLCHIYLIKLKCISLLSCIPTTSIVKEIVQ